MMVKTRQGKIKQVEWDDSLPFIIMTFPNKIFTHFKRRILNGKSKQSSFLILFNNTVVKQSRTFHFYASQDNIHNENKGRCGI